MDAKVSFTTYLTRKPAVRDFCFSKFILTSFSDDLFQYAMFYMPKGAEGSISRYFMKNTDPEKLMRCMIRSSPVLDPLSLYSSLTSLK